MPTNFSHLGGLNAYELLGVDSTATAPEIEAAYRTAIKRNHSDVTGVTRLHQLINDAHEAVTDQRAVYDQWLRDQARDLAAPPEEADDEEWDPWADAEAPPPDGWSDEHQDSAYDPWDLISTPSKPHQAGGSTIFVPQDQVREQRRTARRNAPLAQGPLALLAAIVFAPVGLWLGIRSCRSWRGPSPSAVLAIVIGAAGVALMSGIALTALSSWSAGNGAPGGSLVKEGEVALKPGVKVSVDDAGSSFTPISKTHRSFAATKSGITFDTGTYSVVMAATVAERYETCAGVDYTQRKAKSRAVSWKQLEVGTKICAASSYGGDHKAMLTVLKHSGRSATVRVVTWKD